MKNSTQLFSTVSLLVLLSTTPDNLWAMTNDGTEEVHPGKTTTAVKGPEVQADQTGTGVAVVKPEEGKTEVAPQKSGAWWPFSWGSSATPEDGKKDGATTLTPQDAAKAAETLKDDTLKVIGMTRGQFEASTADTLQAHLGNDALSDAERQFLREAISAKSQYEDLNASALSLAQATPEQLEELKKDPELSPDMQQLAASALEVKKEGGTEAEQTAKIVAKATEEWGWASKAAYYTLGAPFILMKGLYNGVTGAFSSAFGGRTPAQPSDVQTLVPVAHPSDPVNEGVADTATTAKKKKKKEKEKTEEQIAAIRKAAELARQKAETEKLLTQASREDLANREARLKKDLSMLLESLRKIRAERDQSQKSQTQQHGNTQKGHGKRK